MGRIRMQQKRNTRHNLLEGCFFPGFGQDDELCPDWKPDESGGTWPPFPNFPGFEETLWPLCAAVWYATHQQDEFGHIRKAWTFDHILRCAVNQTTNYKDQQIVPDQIMIVEDMLALMTFDDVRVDKSGNLHSMTDILISDIGYPVVSADEVQSPLGIDPVYYESGGTRQGLSTLYEISGVLPHNGFQGNDYFKVVVSRSMHQELLD